MPQSRTYGPKDGARRRRHHASRQRYTIVPRPAIDRDRRESARHAPNMVTRTPEFTNAFVLMILTAFIAGCAAQDKPPPTTPGPETIAPPPPIAYDVLEERFDRHERLPEGWNPEQGEWIVASDVSAPSAPNILRGKAGDVSSSLRASARFAEFDATVLLRIEAGDGGAGLLFARSGEDHGVVLYTPRDATWRLVSYEDGEARHVDESDVAVASTGEGSADWMALRVLLEGARLQAWHNAVLVLDVQDAGPPRAGELGLFVASGTAASFDDLRAIQDRAAAHATGMGSPSGGRAHRRGGNHHGSRHRPLGSIFHQHSIG
jgi:hypothetical protein